MSKRLRAHLSYANVMATIAVFLGLGGGIAWALATDSVKSKHIKDGQVKFADLNDTAQPLGYSYLASTGDNFQEEILSEAGYSIRAACENVSGAPSIELFNEFPEDGLLAGDAVIDPSGGPSNSGTSPPREVDAGTPIDQGGAITASTGESVSVAIHFAYTGSTRAAAIDLYATADDDDDTCRVSGVLTPGELPAE